MDRDQACSRRVGGRQEGRMVWLDRLKSRLTLERLWTRDRFGLSLVPSDHFLHFFLLPSALIGTVLLFLLDTCVIKKSKNLVTTNRSIQFKKMLVIPLFQNK
jgi:hypothetical protein